MIELNDYLLKISKESKFKLDSIDFGGCIRFRNSGKRGGEKTFVLEVKSFIQTFRDINQNINIFSANKTYDEKTWRELLNYFSDEAVYAMGGVQTKPLFVILNKINSWANELDYHSDDFFNISKININRTIDELIKLNDNAFMLNEDINVVAVLASRLESKKLDQSDIKLLKELLSDH
jgi:hypothetical protein